MAVTTASRRRSSLRLVRFTSNVGWTVPPGVFHVEVWAVGGGAGATRANNGNPGGDTTVELSASVTITGNGMASNPVNPHLDSGANNYGDGTPNTGDSGRRSAIADPKSGDTTGSPHEDNRGAVMYGAGAVTPGSTVTVTIGSGGSGTGNGASGVATIAYRV